MESYRKDFDKWNTCIKELDTKSFNEFFYTREIWWCTLGVNVGSEQDGKHDDFIRPVLIVKKISPTFMWIVPFTTKIVENDYRITTETEGVQSQIILSQFRSISSKRLVRKIGKLNHITFYQVLIKLSFLVLGVIKNETPP